MTAAATSGDPAAHMFMPDRITRLIAVAAVLMLASCASTPAPIADAGDGKYASAGMSMADILDNYPDLEAAGIHAALAYAARLAQTNRVELLPT